MKIWVYTIAYNESHFVKCFLRAYAGAEKIIVYDNMSTDNTVELLKQDSRVEIRQHDSGGQIRDDLYLQVKNNCWKEARGIADWVIIVDFDEIFSRYTGSHKFDMGLKDLFDTGVDLIIPNGYCIYMDNMPLGLDINPLEFALRGVYDKNSEKPCCFRPDKVAEINYNPGCHSANPVGIDGNLRVLSGNSSCKLIHFKYISITLYFNRLAEYKKRMSEYNLKTGFGVHYTWDFDTHRDIWLKGLANALPLNLITKSD